MKHLLIALCACLMAFPARADSDLLKAIENRPDLSSFSQALVNTGVIDDLRSGGVYTIFAPDNAAFAIIRRDEYPCFYSVRCKAEVAQIIRNHIVPGRVDMDDAIQHQGGLFSISRRFIRIWEPSKDHYAVEGNNIRSTEMLGGGILYTIDGVIASKRELDMLPLLDYASEPQEHVTVRQKNIHDPACAPAGCPDVYSKTTTTDRVIYLSPDPNNLQGNPQR